MKRLDEINDDALKQYVNVLKKSDELKKDIKELQKQIEHCNNIKKFIEENGKKWGSQLEKEIL